MSCGKRYCTCCETAYAEGLADGFKSGFKIGFERGHRSGYISGYLDGREGREPLPDYKHEITTLIAFEKYQPPELVDPGRLKCGCYWTCTCKASKPEPILSFKSRQLSCGCYGTCTCLPFIPTANYLNRLRKRRCTCIGVCHCGNGW